MPFMEEGAQKLLIKNKKLIFTTNDKKFLKNTKVIIVCIGTPVKNSKPDLIYFLKMFKEVKKYINPKNLLVIRSSIYPGTYNKVQKLLVKNLKMFLIVLKELYKENQSLNCQIYLK